MNAKHLLLVAASLAGSLTPVSAHVSVSGDRTLNNGSPIDNTTQVNGNRTVSSSFGWADATDGNWGDSHRLTAFKFTLATTQTVAIEVARRAAGTGPANTLLPAFTLFQTPAFVASTHDTAAATVSYLTGQFGTGAVGESFVNTNGNGGYEAGDPFVDTNGSLSWDLGEQFTDLEGDGVWEFGDSFTDNNGNGVFDGAGIGGSGKEGAFRALDPWKIFQDNVAGTEMDFNTVIGHAADGTSVNYGGASGINGDGVADGTVAATFTDLAPGDYYLFVGGGNYTAQNSADVLAGGSTYRTYGITLTVSSVPEPSTGLLLTGGLVAMAFWRRSRVRR
ncbi:MAG: PEP-CTERM sorting domain-containing protein [Candidatus Methylacidiphilales bacterium]|nr:PEP-CTERM sorting domain-containing protein [Candidatus Methylacidiphilales bacterium]